MDLRTRGGGRVSWDEVREWHGLIIYTNKCKVASGKQPHSTLYSNKDVKKKKKGVKKKKKAVSKTCAIIQTHIAGILSLCCFHRVKVG